MPVILSAEQISAAWLAGAIGADVVDFEVSAGRGSWSHQFAIRAQLADGSQRALRLKVCAGTTFGRSEIDYYRRDYLGLADAPLVRCHDAQYDAARGYHLLLDDLSATHEDQRDTVPTLGHALALARAIGRLHRHHWQTAPAPTPATIDRYLDEIRPGVAPFEAATGLAWRARFEAHEAAFRERWADARGMTLLHGDINPTNVLVPRGEDAPVLIIDRQPFDWSLTYGVAAYDLAYAMLPWWPPAFVHEHQAKLLRAWHETLGGADYTWHAAQADWRLAIEQCMNVPLEWCSKPDTLTSMRWLWLAQADRIRAALASLSPRSA